MTQSIDEMIAELRYSLIATFDREIKRANDRADRLESELARLNNMTQDKIIPTLIECTQAVQASSAYLMNLQYQRDLEDVANRRAKTGNEKAKENAEKLERSSKELQDLVEQMRRRFDEE